METQTSTEVGETTPTPTAEMSSQNDSPETTSTNIASSTQSEQGLLAELKAAGITKYSTKEEAVEGFKHLTNLVGDQTVAKQRKLAEHLQKSTNMSLEELNDILESGNVELNTPQPSEQPSRDGKIALQKANQVLVREFVREHPEAKPLEEKILREALKTGKDPEQIWADEYEPVYRLGTEKGAKKLNSTIEGQPVKAVSTDSSETSTNLDLDKLSAAEMRKHLPKATT